MSALPTGTVTFLFTDIEGSTHLWERQPNAMRTALVRHDVLLHQSIADQKGVVFKTMGDGFCAAFHTAPDALTAALAAQQALIAEPWPAPAAVRVRMALHTGAADERDGDYFGPPLNRVARLLSTGHGGQILLSQSSYELTRDALPENCTLQDLGAHTLRDLVRTEHLYQLLHPDLPSEFSPLKSLNSLPNNLPQQTSSLVGRTEELAEVTRLLTRTRLLTLTGTGGTGKTRLALQVAADLLDTYPDGVWLAELSTLTDPTLALRAVAAVVGTREETGQPLMETVTAFLRNKSLLLVLDNCEHLIESCAFFAETLMQSCAGLKILATSRESLGISGEYLFPVPALSLPNLQRLPPLEKLLDYGAIRLFVERATSVHPSFAVTPQNAAAVASLCHQLDGTPLCLQLAAARVRTYSVEQISARMKDRFRLLSGGSRTAERRQQTIEACIDWSDHLLTDAERLLFRRLSVFTGGWTLEAAEAVCSDTDLESDSIFDLLPGLVQKSLVLAEVSGDETRYRFLETLRQYAWERLLTMPDAEALRERHSDYFLALAERTEPEMEGPQQAFWLDCLETENDNLRAALLWFGDAERRLRLAAALYRFWYVRGYWSEGRVWLEGGATSQAALPDPLRAKALNRAGIMAWAQGSYPDAQGLYEQSLALFQKLEEKKGTASTLHNLGIVANEQKNFDLARAYYEQSLTIWRELDNKQSIARILSSLGGLFTDSGDPTAARPFLEESLALQRELGNSQGIATVLYNLAEVNAKQRNFAVALSLYQQRLALEQELKRPQGIFLSLRGVAMMAGALGDYQKSAFLLSAAENLRQLTDKPIKVGDLTEYEEAVLRAREALGEEEFNALWQKGMKASQEQVMESAFQ